MTFGIDDVLAAGLRIVDKVLPDPQAKAAAALEAAKMKQAGDFKELEAEITAMTAQTDINKIEAASSSLFVSGWRPAVGWVCVSGCAWNWALMPAIKTALALLGRSVPLQAADLSEMLPLLLGMLGIGGLRTWEKFRGVARQ